MTPEAVEKRVGEIAELLGDPEGAHTEEDRLHQAVLLMIASGACDDPVECARAAVKTLELDFPRGCA